MQYLLLLALVCGAETPQWNDVPFGQKTLRLHPKCRRLATLPMGPFVKLGDGSVLAVDGTRVLVSRDDGKNWKARPLFAEPDKYDCRSERAVLLTREGTLVVAFMNQREQVFRWDQKKGGPQPGCRLPVYATRSTDGGKTWEKPRLVQDGYCGALRTMIQLRSGRIVLGCQDARANRGRHVCMTYVSDDQGETWKRSSDIDLGDYGGYGDHGGGIEPTVAELKDGRLWMLIRTYRGCFTEAFSSDEGLTWKEIGPSKTEEPDFHVPTSLGWLEVVK